MVNNGNDSHCRNFCIMQIYIYIICFLVDVYLPNTCLIHVILMFINVHNTALDLYLPHVSLCVSAPKSWTLTKEKADRHPKNVGQFGAAIGITSKQHPRWVNFWLRKPKPRSQYPLATDTWRQLDQNPPTGRIWVLESRSHLGDATVGATTQKI